jgi:hypothetical protein
LTALPAPWTTSGQLVVYYDYTEAPPANAPVTEVSATGSLAANVSLLAFFAPYPNNKLTGLSFSCSIEAKKEHN